MTRIASRTAALAVAAVTLALFGSSARAIGATPSHVPPTISVTMTGRSITVSDTVASGAVTVRSLVTRERFGEPTLVHLNAGVSYAQAFAGIGQTPDPNAVTPYGSIVFNALARRGTSSAQTLLPAGHYIALDTGRGMPPFPVTTFTVARASAPAALPAPTATQTAIDFAFRGAAVLHDGTMVRARNDGWLVHMIVGAGVRNAATGRAVIALLRTGQDRKAQRLETRSSFTLALPISHGAVQQMVLKTKPGYYVETCSMSTQDGREHTQLGMMRLIRVVR